MVLCTIFTETEMQRMKITLYNANENPSFNGIDRLTEDLAVRLEASQQVQKVYLRDLEIKTCTGCWDCWVKTPGKCVAKDDMEVVYRSFLQSDLVIFLAPMVMGFPSSLMKKVNDKLIPLVHPYITLVEDECHHQPRYDSYPDWGLILGPETDTDEDDLDIVRSIYQRTALNIKCNLLFTFTTEKPVHEIVYEIDHLQRIPAGEAEQHTGAA